MQNRVFSYDVSFCKKIGKFVKQMYSVPTLYRTVSNLIFSKTQLFFTCSGMQNYFLLIVYLMKRRVKKCQSVFKISFFTYESFSCQLCYNQEVAVYKNVQNAQNIRRKTNLYSNSTSLVELVQIWICCNICRIIMI